MSWTVEALTAAWRVASAETRELAGQLLRAAAAVNATLAVPEAAPGWDRARTAIGAESTAEDARAALTAYDDAAVRYGGLSLDGLFARRREGLVVPTWASVRATAEQRGGPRLAASVLALESAYGALRADGGALAQQVDDGAARIWLAARLQSVTRQPEDSGLAKLLVVGIVLYLLTSKGDA